MTASGTFGGFDDQWRRGEVGLADVQEDHRPLAAGELARVLEMVKAVRGLGMETCATLGMLRDGQAEQLKDAGLDYYNHNLDSAPEFYDKIIHTREFQDRLDTLSHVRDAGFLGERGLYPMHDWMDAEERQRREAFAARCIPAAP